jgi:hypothetical protein
MHDFDTSCREERLGQGQRSQNRARVVGRKADPGPSQRWAGRVIPCWPSFCPPEPMPASPPVPGGSSPGASPGRRSGPSRGPSPMPRHRTAPRTAAHSSRGGVARPLAACARGAARRRGSMISAPSGHAAARRMCSSSSGSQRAALSCSRGPNLAQTPGRRSPAQCGVGAATSIRLLPFAGNSCRSSSLVVFDGAAYGTEGHRFESCRARYEVPASGAICRLTAVADASLRHQWASISSARRLSPDPPRR